MLVLSLFSGDLTDAQSDAMPAAIQMPSMRRLLMGASIKHLPGTKPAHPFEKGDLCLAPPPVDLKASYKDKDLYLAIVHHHSPPQVVFFDDGSETVHVVAKLVDAPVAERDAAKTRYLAALQEAKRLAGEDSESIITAAIEEVQEKMGGTLGAWQQPRAR